MGSAGKVAMEEERGTCEMLIELHPLIEVGKGVPIIPLKGYSSGVRCDETVCLLTNTSSLCTPNHSCIRTHHLKTSCSLYQGHTGHLLCLSSRPHDWLPLSLSLGLYEESPAGPFVHWLVYLFQGGASLLFRDPIVVPFFFFLLLLHLSVLLKRPINNAPPSPHSCAFEVREAENWERGSKSGIHESNNVSLCLCRGKRTGCLSNISDI